LPLICKRIANAGVGLVPFHVWITPDDQRSFFGIRKWNLDEETLLRQFVEPYRAGAPITTDGEVVRMDELQWMRISRSDTQLAPPTVVSFEWDFFKGLEQVTDDYLEGPPGYTVSENLGPAGAEPTAVDRAVRVCERFPRLARELARRGRDRAPLTMGDEYDVQYLLRALLSLEFVQRVLQALLVRVARRGRRVTRESLGSAFLAWS
jgi:REase_DpnII-MboI